MISLWLGIAWFFPPERPKQKGALFSYNSNGWKWGGGESALPFITLSRRVFNEPSESKVLIKLKKQKKTQKTPPPLAA